MLEETAALRNDKQHLIDKLNRAVYEGNKELAVEALKQIISEQYRVKISGFQQQQFEYQRMTILMNRKSVTNQTTIP